MSSLSERQNPGHRCIDQIKQSYDGTSPEENDLFFQAIEIVVEL